MDKPLTKEAFLEGKPFYKAVDKDYSIESKSFFKYDVLLKDGFPVIKEYLKYEKEHKWRYHANIAKIADEFFIIYTSLCSKTTDVKIYYHEYNFVEEATDGTN